jgi:hypothetical protein
LTRLAGEGFGETGWRGTGPGDWPDLAGRVTRRALVRPVGQGMGEAFGQGSGETVGQT